jgi:hypothetical protein
MADRPQRWRIGPKVAYEFVDDEVVALDLQRGAYYRLNAVAASAWRLLLKRPVLDDLVDGLLEEFDVDRDRLEADLSELFVDLVKHGLVTREV